MESIAHQAPVRRWAAPIVTPTQGPGLAVINARTKILCFSLGSSRREDHLAQSSPLST